MNNIYMKKHIYWWAVYVSFLIFILCAAADFEFGITFFKILSLLLLGLFLFQKDEEYPLNLEKSILILVIMFFNIFLLQHKSFNTEFWFVDVLCSMLSIVMGFIFFLNNYSNLHIRKWFSKNRGILAVIFVFFLLSKEVIGSWLMWDARIYYSFSNGGGLTSILTNFDATLADVYGLYLGGHASLGYSLWHIFFQLCKEGSDTVQIADIFLAGISIFSYYYILRKILGNRMSPRLFLIATILYAFSPFLLGIVGDFNLDSAIMYFFVIFMACSLYHFEVFELIFAFCLCFTKEPAIIYYVIYILTKVICDYFKSNSFHFVALLKYGFGNIKNYVYAMPVILWMILRVMDPNNGWSKETKWKNEGFNCFGISSNVILMKLKQTFFLNFNWIFWMIILFGCIVLLTRKYKADKEIIIKTVPIAMVCVTIIAFGCLYITWTHARYIVPLVPALYLISTIVLVCFIKKEIKLYILNCILCILLLMQCFSTIDPITKIFFHALSVGNGEIYSMQLSGNERIFDNVEFHDSIVYNRQYIYWQKALKATLEEAGYDGNMLIVLPDDVNCTQISVFGGEESLWNMQEYKLEYSNKDINVPKQCNYIKACNTREILDSLDATNSNRILYIIPGWANIDTDFVSKHRIIRQGEVNIKWFKTQYLIMDIEYNLPINEGFYIISPMHEKSLGLCTNGSDIMLQENVPPIKLLAGRTKYNFIFEEYQVNLDVQYGRVDENGTVHVWEANDTNAQKWTVEQIDKNYYMICWGDYALTYYQKDNLVRLTPKTGEDNQLWSFTRS